jgi:hypothetical protein
LRGNVCPRLAIRLATAMRTRGIACPGTLPNFGR